MNKTSQRENGRDYLVVEAPAGSEDAGTLRVLEEAPSDLFIPVTQRTINGNVQICCDITSCRSLRQLSQRSRLSGSMLLRILDTLSRAIRECNRYLAVPEDLLIHPEDIYLSSDLQQIRFCLIPGSGEGNAMQYQEFAEFILRRIDHADPLAVHLGYLFYDRTGQDGFCFPDVWEDIRSRSPENHRPPAAQMPELSPLPGSSPDTGDKAGGDTGATRGRIREQKRKAGKKRKKSRTSGRKKLLLSGLISGSVILYLLIIWLAGLTVLQMGGLFFLFVSGIWLTVSLLSGHRSVKLPDSDAFTSGLSEEEEDFYQLLQEEPVPPAAVPAYHPQDPGDESTCFPDTSGGMPAVQLISLNARKSPDLVIKSASVLIGKSSKDADLVIGLNVISRVHARLELSGAPAELYLTDLNSTNGTFVDGERLRPGERRKLQNLQQVSFATAHYQVLISGPSSGSASV